MATEHTRGGNAVQTAMTQPLKAVAFDLDSTLCHYALTVEEVIERALERVGLSDPWLGRLDELAATYSAAWWRAEEELRLPTEELRRAAWTHILNDRGVADEATALSIADAYGEIRRETGIRLFDGVPSLLDDLRARYRTGILTNGPSDMQWEKLKELNLADAVDAIVVAGDLGIFKPDPRPFLQLLDRLEASPERSIFVGDSLEHDIAGARRVGMRTVWISSNGKADNADWAPDHVFHRVEDLRGILL
ncbi:HAD family hydrolase [Candidatus Bipolaricaulota bacterium]